MNLTDQLSGRSLRLPRALLLDFGGVIVRTERIPDWEKRLAGYVGERLAGAGGLSAARIARDITAACKADSNWKDAMSRPYAPRELTHGEFWGDFVAADWPPAARSVVVSEAAELCRRMGHMRSRRELRGGILDLLDRAAAADVPVGIVSNALSGQVHLDFLQEHGLMKRFAAVIHSDAVGVRKPNPEMILLAARQLGIEPADLWYVGDNVDRDVLCGVRAGVAGNILMEAATTWDLIYDLDVRPDAIVADPVELLALFGTVLQKAA
jgi:HAD superfamily hydrolase (TIGR01549 family)